MNIIAGNPNYHVIIKVLMHPKIWLSSPHMGGTEQKYVQEAFDSNWVAPLGPNVTGFEEDLEDFDKVLDTDRSIFEVDSRYHNNCSLVIQVLDKTELLSNGE